MAKRNIIPLIKRSVSGKITEGAVVEQGTIGNLKIEVYERGVIHITDPKKSSLVFKKDPDIFVTDLEKHHLEDLPVGQSVKIEGSGDNDHLVLTMTDKGIVVSLEKRGFGVLGTLMNFINKAKAIAGKPTN